MAIPLALSVTISSCLFAQAEPLPIDKLEQSGQEAYEQGKFKKAENSWTKAVKTLEDNGQKDSFLETCLKRLGQTYRKLERTVEAYQTLMRALEMCNALGIQDKELAKELTELSTDYRPIDVSVLGNGAAIALKKANVTSVGLIKNGTGSKLQIDMPERYEKQLENETIDGIALEKKVTVDLDEDSNGTITLTNIKGFKIHAKEKNMWVSLLQTVIQPAESDGQYPAHVTAGKMGVTKTVAARLPASGFEPLGGVLKQARAMVTPLPVTFDSAAATSAPATSPALSVEAGTENSSAPGIGKETSPATSVEVGNEARTAPGVKSP